MKDGSPQVTEIWVDFEDGNIIVNTAEGRLKHKNISRDPRIAICVVDHKQSISYGYSREVELLNRLMKVLKST